MPQIQLKYGHTSIPFAYDENRFEVLNSGGNDRPLSDVEIGERFDDPINAKPLEETIQPGESVLIVVPDATRQAGSGQIVNLLVRRLIASGTSPFDITVIFATGIHRAVTEAEKASIVTPFILQRVKSLDHRPRDLMQIVSVGDTSGGIPVELNRSLLEHDHVILIGSVNFHYFAGFTGGRKLICPGLASSKTIAATHKLAFDCESKGRRKGVGSGLLDGNAVHESFIEAATKIDRVFCISTFVNDAGEVTELYCGDLSASHRAACDAYAAKHTIEIAEKRDLVIVSCGGYPYDINMIQAHKALDAAAGACNDGGTLIFLAECSEGLGRDDFLQWFNAGTSGEMAAKLCDRYQVNGQTAWSIMKKGERFHVWIMTSLPDTETRKMGMQNARSIEDVVLGANREEKIYIIPSGNRILCKVNQRFSE